LTKKGEKNSHTQLMGIQIVATTNEYIMDAPHKTKNRTTI
jgi:hypothetical protein